MKKIKFGFKRKHALTATCLLVGMFMLTSAVYANYDDARGYTNYKNAVKDLAFYAENFSGAGDVSILVDGKVFGSVQGELKLDGDSQFTRTVSEGYESQEFVADGKGYVYQPKTNSYYEVGGGHMTTIRGDLNMSDPTMKKAVRFAELFADTMIGDLKNNFVLTSNEGDLRNYSVNVSGSQIPEVVNAGISFMFTSLNSQEYQQGSMVTYDNYYEAFKAFYKEQTGEEMTEDMYQAWTPEVEKINEDFLDKYSDILEAKGNQGLVCVRGDSSYDYYKTYDEYMESADYMSSSLKERDIMAMLGNDPYIESAVCNFALDKNGNLVSNEMEASMAGVDKNGKKHIVTMKVNLHLSDYGTTKVETFDTTGKTLVK